MQKNLSQEQLSELASCHPTYIGQLERREKNATLESIQKVAQALDIPLSQLFEKIEEKQNEESIPLQIYDFFSSKNKKEQKYLYQNLI
ncbi:MAG: helix-turn-helix transcriptional regulator [Faecalibacillus faecis]